MYNNFNNNRNQYGQKRGYRQNNYGGYPQHQGYGQQQPQQRPKKSGAKYSIIKQGKHEGSPIVNAWMSTRQGLVKITIAPYHGTRKVESSANTFLTMMASVQVGFNPPQLMPCLYNITNKKVVLSNIGLLVTPNGGGMTRSGKRVTGSVVKLQK